MLLDMCDVLLTSATEISIKKRLSRVQFNINVILLPTSTRILYLQSFGKSNDNRAGNIGSIGLLA
jgi:hypothetical protein